MKCTFCGNDVESGTGILYVYKTGKTANLCSSKCKKNLIDLGRNPIHTRWSKRFKE